MRVLVCGGRNYDDQFSVSRTLNALRILSPISLLIYGGSRGADDLGRGWAEGQGISTMCFPADWEAHGPAAGPIRNTWMLREGKPDIVVAFPGGKGTADMVRKARAAGVRVFEPCT